MNSLQPAACSSPQANDCRTTTPRLASPPRASHILLVSHAVRRSSVWESWNDEPGETSLASSAPAPVSRRELVGMTRIVAGEYGCAPGSETCRGALRNQKQRRARKKKRRGRAREAAFRKRRRGRRMTTTAPRDPCRSLSPPVLFRAAEPRTRARTGRQVWRSSPPEVDPANTEPPRESEPGGLLEPPETGTPLPRPPLSTRGEPARTSRARQLFPRCAPPPGHPT